MTLEKKPPEISRIWIKLFLIIWILVLPLILSASCQTAASAGTATPDTLFVPPTADPVLIYSPGSLVVPLPTSQANCVNQLRFLEDLTIPDGTEVNPGERITKRWLIRNDGSCNWDQSYSMQLISGLALGTAKIQQLYPARQNTKAILEIVFTAPDNTGRYNSWWQAFDSSGQRFGDPVYLEISVVEK